MKPEEIISKFCLPSTRLYNIVIQHGKEVGDMAVDIAGNLSSDHCIDLQFIMEASMLHDIGICRVDYPKLDCHGNHPYICHGYLGRELLEELGLPRHGLVCERHVGTGITMADINTHHLPLPLRDMAPVSIEEQIICYADKFFSKSNNGSTGKKNINKIIAQLETYGHDKVVQFQSWVEMFSNGSISVHGV